MEFKTTKRNGKEYYYFYISDGIQYSEDGTSIERNRKRLYSKTKRGLEKKIQEYNKRREAGIRDEINHFGILMEEWIQTFFLTDEAIKDSTKSTYLRVYKKYIRNAEFYPSELGSISASRIQKWYLQLRDSGIKASNIRKINNFIKRFYTFVDLEGYGKNVTLSLKVPKDLERIEKKEIIIWTDDELKKIMEGLDDADKRFRLRFFIIVAMMTGLRFGEILALKKSDFMDDGVHVRRQLQEELCYNSEGKDEYKPRIEDVKTESSNRIVPINEIVRDELKRHLEFQERDARENGYDNDEGYLFLTSKGTFYNKRNVRRALERYYNIIGIEPKSVHSYRRTFATKICRNTSLDIASKILGHSSLETTAMFYVSASRDLMQESVDKLMDIF